MWALILALLACQAPAEDTGSPLPVVAPVEPSLAAEEVDAAVDALLAGTFPLPLDVYTWFEGVLADIEGHEGEGCPAARTDPAVVSYGYSGGCVGEQYEVQGDYQIAMTRSLADGVSTLEGWELYSLRGETLPEGEPLVAGGFVEILWRTSDGVVEIAMNYGGSFEDPSYPAFAEGESLGYRIDGILQDGALDGHIAGGIGGDPVSLVLQDLSFQSGCAGPIGSMQVRDPSSALWDVTLADDCSGCGTLTWNGEDRGTSCAGASVQRGLLAALASYVEVPP